MNTSVCEPRGRICGDGRPDRAAAFKNESLAFPPPRGPAHAPLLSPLSHPDTFLSSVSLQTCVCVESLRSTTKSIGTKSRPSPHSHSQSQSPPFSKQTHSTRTVLHLQRAFSVGTLFLFLRDLSLLTSSLDLEVLLFRTTALCRWAPCRLISEDVGCSWSGGPFCSSLCVCVSLRLFLVRGSGPVFPGHASVFKVCRLKQMRLTVHVGAGGAPRSWAQLLCVGSERRVSLLPLRPLTRPGKQMPVD